MTQNIHNAVIYLGHQNGTSTLDSEYTWSDMRRITGTVTLHTPSTPTPLVRLQAHLGPITSLSVDPSSGGRYLATAGQDSRVKIWDCRNWKGCVREWTARGGAPSEVEWSRRGWLGVIAGGAINVSGDHLHKISSGSSSLYCRFIHPQRFTHPRPDPIRPYPPLYTSPTLSLTAPSLVCASVPSRIRSQLAMRTA